MIQFKKIFLALVIFFLVGNIFTVIDASDLVFLEGKDDANYSIFEVEGTNKYIDDFTNFFKDPFLEELDFNLFNNGKKTDDRNIVNEETFDNDSYENVYVDDDADPSWYNASQVRTIAEGIYNASDGGTVYVYSGTYYENVIVDKSITLQGEDKNTTIIDGSEDTIVVQITADNVNLSNFTIQNASGDGFFGVSYGIYTDSNHTFIYSNIVKDNNAWLASYGITIYNSHNNTISNNVVFNNSNSTVGLGYGIFVTGSEDNNIHNNTCYNDVYGILLTESLDCNVVNNILLNYNGTVLNNSFFDLSNNITIGVICYNCININISNNEFLNTSLFIFGNDSAYYYQNVYDNLVNEKPLFYSTNNNDLSIPPDVGQIILVNYTNFVIENKMINYTALAINLFYSDNIIIRNSTVNNSYIGIYQIYSDNCSIYNNTFMDNTMAIELDICYNNDIFHNNFLSNYYQAYDYDNNRWYNTTLNQGNYWDDYNGTDANNDGIGDSPYDILMGSNQDPYPLMYERTIPPTFVWVDDDYNSSTPGWNIDHFDTIQKGIDNVTGSGGIYVYNGVYAESLELYKSVNLVGNNSDGVIINGQGLSGNGINITANNTLVQGFTIKNFTILDGFRNGFGICIYNSSFMVHNANIFSNQIYNNVLGGIFINNSNCNNINMNQIYNNTVFGIILYLSDNNTINNSNQIYNQVSGIIVYTSNNNTINNSNQIYNHTESGIYIVDSSENNTINNSNQIYNNYRGIYLLSSSNNSINTNQIYNNTYGISLFVSSVSSNNNNIYNNNFNNTNNAVIDETINNWNTTKTLGTNIIGGPYIGGNYWSDYTGFDTDHDGLGDTNYTVGDNNDTYPLIISPAVSTNSPIDSSVSISANIAVTFDKSMNQTTTEGNFSLSPSVNGVFSWDNNNKTMTFNPSSNLGYSKQYTVTIDWNSTDSQGNVMLDNHSWSFTTESEPSSPGPGPGPSGGDTTAPTAPTNVRCTTSETDNTPSFSWIASTDSSGIDGYYVKIDGGSDTWVGNVLSWTSNNAINDGTHTFYVKAKDASTNKNNGSYGSCSFNINTTFLGKSPVADAGGPYTGLTYQNITFDGSKSYDLDGTIVNYTWNLGDQTTIYGKTVKHRYNKSGIYNITLTVIDNASLADTDTTTINVLLDSDVDGWSDDDEDKYGTDKNDTGKYPIDNDNDRLPDDYDNDDDNDGVPDQIEESESVGSNPKDDSDTLKININGSDFYLIDINKDGIYEYLYNPIGKITDVGISEDGRLLLDVVGDEGWDYYYNPLNSEIDTYEEKPDSSDDFPWMILIIGIIIIIIVLTIFILYKKGYIWVERYYK